MNTPIPSANAAPAYALWVELATRVTTQPLHYRSGDEETAAESIYGLFKKARLVMEEHPAAPQFRELALTLLNDILRPYTARWHGWLTEDKERKAADGRPLLRFRDEQVRRLFRSELQELRPKLIEIRAELAQLAGLADVHSEKVDQKANLGADLRAGIGPQVYFKSGFGSAADPATINAREHATLLERRRILAGRESQEAGLINATGLALSGGGIRSATFCLGVVQVLARKGLLLDFDYLSTVSGGGYFGSFLSCALGSRLLGQTAETTKASAAERLNQVFHRHDGVESDLVRQLRNNSKYLLHGGLAGKLRILGLLLSGFSWNLIIMLPVPLAAALLAYLAGPSLWGDAITAGGPVLAPNAPAGVALAGLAIASGAAWLALPGIELLAHGQNPQSPRAILRNIWANLTLALGLLTVAAAALFLTPALFHFHEWLRGFLAKVGTSGANLKGVAGAIPASVTGVASAVLGALATWLSPRWPRLRALAVKLFILSGPLLLIFVFLFVGNRLGLARAAQAPWQPEILLWVTLGLTVWDWFCININTLAPHRYYRDRLCECYLARHANTEQLPRRRVARALSGERAEGGVEILKQLKLTELSADLTAPYHLLNMTLNAPTSANKELRGRGGDFFMVSRHFYGSPLTGYAPTEELERADPHFDLGTAMAVSGAAASTSMGWKSLPHFRFLMTLLNVRLGYWIRNPARKPLPRVLEGAGPWYLFREMLGAMDEGCRYLNLSDGGHIENLAVYELLRRRCKFIVCVDAGCEPGMECADLLRLERYAEIDLGIRMKMDLADLQLGPNGLSRAYAVLVKIDYAPETAPNQQLGWMLYLKLAVTGLEPAYVKDYRRENPVFPHQSTTDQLYDEAQFEAYRALGECAMEGLFRDELLGQQRPTTLKAWFQSLATNLLPDNDQAFRA